MTFVVAYITTLNSFEDILLTEKTLEERCSGRRCLMEILWAGRERSLTPATEV